MKIKIIRGQNQIGGSIIEVRSQQARIILDVGMELDEDTPKVPRVRGLFYGTPAYDAVFVTHYHLDHLGLGTYVLPGIPLYMGQKAAQINTAAASFFNKPSAQVSGFLQNGQAIVIKDISITPFLCDHAAFDSYMLLLESGGKRILYTGDFRSTGRKNFAALLSQLPKVDVLITEGTTLTRVKKKPLTEKALEKSACKKLGALQGPAFIFMASTNIDRLVTAYNAAVNSGRIFLEDLYTAAVAKAAGANIPQPARSKNVRVFLTLPQHYNLLQQYGGAKIGKKGIAREKFLMCVRPSMQNYLEKLSQLLAFKGGVLFYSMWQGYKAKTNVAAFLDFMRKKGVTVTDLHTSGHADEVTIQVLIFWVDPDYIIPVHTQNADWFKKNTYSRVIRGKTFEI